MKTCSRCQEEKPLSEFPTYAYFKKGISPKCRSCINEVNREYYAKNIEKSRLRTRAYRKTNNAVARASSRKYYANNKDKVIAQSKQHRHEIKEVFNARAREKYRSNTEFRLRMCLRGRLYKAIKMGKAGSHIKDLGCTVQDLKAYLESKFQEGMSWDNWSPNGWHIDHIKPLASFDLSNRDQFLLACHHTNLQPLWAEENIVKGDTIQLIQ